MAGIYITRGMTVGIPAGGFSLSIGDDGKINSSLTLHVRFDVCPTWIELSLQHLATATEAGARRQAAWAGTDEEAKSAALEREFESSMQAVMAAAIALDAFYAMIQPHVVLPPTLVERWRTGRTARFSQVTEIVRRAFRLKPKGTAALRANLKEIYRVRDLAVHPSGKIEAPIYHPELDVGVEWRFAYFCASNAELIVNGATWILWDLCHGGKPADAKVLEYIGNLKQRLIALFPNGHPSAATAVSPP
ncbi:hypothetical protein GCM10007935_31400 [Hydrogenophaga electricum]|uniref:Uncharacterized protein n=2 Tax=Hydrogenophaga electricum TaxID=1230953 RepID=A0ABQ6CAG4_9BURK|nr:hypothetical protein GCM10007935_31400 [Hydrogenophaga electricum]